MNFTFEGHKIERRRGVRVLNHEELLAGDFRLRQSIRLRNPYVDPISLLQVDLLARWRAAGRPEDDALFHALPFIPPEEHVLVGLPDTVWFPETGFDALGDDELSFLCFPVDRPEFFDAVDRIVKERPLSDWKVYLRWHLLRSTAPYLHSAAERENFAFYATKLRGQPQPEPAVRARHAPVALAEVVEDMRQHVGRDALAVVGHAEAHALGRALEPLTSSASSSPAPSRASPTPRRWRATARTSPIYACSSSWSSSPIRSGVRPSAPSAPRSRGAGW